MPHRFSRLQVLLLIISICMALAGTLKAWRYTKQYTGTDLECRIRGARLQYEGYSAYFTHTTATQQLLLNGVSVPPSVLLLHYPLLSLSYPQARTAWFVVQYLLLFGTFLLLAGRLRSSTADRITLAVAAIAVFFCCGAHWLLHTERGQLYVLYAFLFGLMFALYKRGGWWPVFFAGMILGFAAWLRILFIVCGVPFVLQKNKAFTSGLFAGAVLCLLLSIPYYHQWQDYASAIDAYTHNTYTYAVHNPIAGEAQFVTGALPASFKNDFITGCIQHPGDYLHWFNIHVPRLFYLSLYAAGVLAFIIFCRKSISRYTSAQRWCFAFLLYMAAEYCVAASRNPYNLIEWLFPVLLVLPSICIRSYTFVFLITGLCLLHPFPLYFPYCFEMGELLLFAGVAGWLFVPQREGPEAK